MTTTKTLSENAIKLLNALKAGSMWEDKAIEVLFPKPQYVGTMDPTYTTEQKIEMQTAYWQHDINFYGNSNSRPVNGKSVEFVMSVEKSYADTTYAAFAELKKAGLVYSKNAGYNVYSYHAK